MNNHHRFIPGEYPRHEVRNQAAADTVASAADSVRFDPSAYRMVRRYRQPAEIAADSDDAFDTALIGVPVLLIGDDGRELPSAAARWYAPADEDDNWLLHRCTGPTLDLGCGPGRLVTELTARGVRALGVDCSQQAVRECQSRGGAVLHRDLFAALPEEGRWRHVLLADGNIGIGGDPLALLRRCAGLVRPGGTLLVETAPGHHSAPGRLWQGNARLHNPTNRHPVSHWFPWAVITTDALTAIAEQLHLGITGTHRGTRRFVELQRADL